MRIAAAVLILFVIVALPEAKAEEYTRVVIYYHDWHLTVRARIGPDTIRTGYLAKLELRSEPDISHFLREMHFSKLGALKTDVAMEDIRLAIDVFNDDGEVTSYYASRFRLFDSTGSIGICLGPNFGEGFALKAIIPPNAFSSRLINDE